MSLKVQNGRLPAGYDLQASITGEGKRWEVIELATGRRVVQNQRNQILAVDRALASLGGAFQRAVQDVGPAVSIAPGTRVAWSVGRLSFQGVVANPSGDAVLVTRDGDHRACVVRLSEISNMEVKTGE